MIFTRDEVTSENHCRIASLVTKNSLFATSENHCQIASLVTKKFVIHSNELLFYFLHAILCHEHTNPLRTIIERSFHHCCQGGPFLTEHCDVTTIDL